MLAAQAVAAAVCDSSFFGCCNLCSCFRLQVATLHIAAGVAAIVAYVVHNAYCWSYAYSTFGAAELVVVASSVALRFIGGLELRGVRLTVSS